MKFSTLLLAGLLAATSARAVTDESYAQTIDAARTKRVTELTKPDGWLTLIGLHFLQPGENTIGRAAVNKVVLTGGPDRLGTATLGADGSVRFIPVPAAKVRIDGEPAAGPVPLVAGRKATQVSAGTVTFFLIERGGKLALRVRDSEAERRAHFVGLNYFPLDPTWRVEAKWVPFASPREVPIVNMLGDTSIQKVTGKAVFERDGKTYELLPMTDGADKPLFFVIADGTSGQTTYQMRFLYTDAPKDGKVVLDFNRAQNPPCAFTLYATCPLPPKENRLAVAITAGEQSYRGADH